MIQTQTEPPMKQRWQHAKNAYNKFVLKGHYGVTLSDVSREVRAGKGSASCRLLFNLY